MPASPARLWLLAASSACSSIRNSLPYRIAWSKAYSLGPCQETAQSGVAQPVCPARSDFCCLDKVIDRVLERALLCRDAAPVRNSAPRRACSSDSSACLTHALHLSQARWQARMQRETSQTQSSLAACHRQCTSMTAAGTSGAHCLARPRAFKRAAQPPHLQAPPPPACHSTSMGSTLLVHELPCEESYFISLCAKAHCTYASQNTSCMHPPSEARLKTPICTGFPTCSSTAALWSTAKLTCRQPTQANTDSRGRLLRSLARRTRGHKCRGAPGISRRPCRAYVCRPSFTMSYGIAVTVSIFTPSSVKPSRGPWGRRLVTGIFSARPQAQCNVRTLHPTCCCVPGNTITRPRTWQLTLNKLQTPPTQGVE